MVVSVTFQADDSGELKSSSSSMQQAFCGFVKPQTFFIGIYSFLVFSSDLIFPREIFGSP